MDLGTSPLGDSFDTLRVKYLAIGALVGIVVVGFLTWLAVRLAASDWDQATALGVAAMAAFWAGAPFGVMGGNAAYEAAVGDKVRDDHTASAH